MTKKIGLFGVVAVAALLALPGVAAAEWMHHNQPLQQTVNLGLTGNVRYQGSLGGMECQSTTTLTLEPGTGADVEVLSTHPTSDTANCKGLGGLAFCQIHEVEFGSKPNWSASSAEGGTKISLKTDNITNQVTGGFCPMKHLRLTSTTILATPNQLKTVSSFQLSASATAHYQTNGGQVHAAGVQITGTLNIVAPNANTYSI